MIMPTAGFRKSAVHGDAIANVRGPGEGLICTLRTRLTNSLIHDVNHPLISDVNRSKLVEQRKVMHEQMRTLLATNEKEGMAMCRMMMGMSANEGGEPSPHH
jgi:hypothetical protein